MTGLNVARFSHRPHLPHFAALHGGRARHGLLVKIPTAHDVAEATPGCNPARALTVLHEATRLLNHEVAPLWATAFSGLRAPKAAEEFLLALDHGIAGVGAPAATAAAVVAPARRTHVFQLFVSTARHEARGTGRTSQAVYVAATDRQALWGKLRVVDAAQELVVVRATTEYRVVATLCVRSRVRTHAQAFC